MTASEDPVDAPRHRRIDRIRDASYVDGLAELPLDELRARRDDCLAEREHLSMLRRLVQGRAEILQAELEARGAGEEHATLVESLSRILAAEDHPASSRGEALRVGLPDGDVPARRSAERLVNDATLSDPGALDDDALVAAIRQLADEEHEVSRARGDVIRALDAVQDELKRRYREDPTLALR